MKTLVFAAACALGLTGVLPAAESSLSQSDRELLIEKLNALRDAVEGKSEERMRTAISAFRNAMGSDDAAVDLYLKCVEKIDFEDQRKKEQEFREWKRNQKEKLESTAWRKAIRHQLRWLVLTMEASTKPDSITDFAPRAIEAVNDIFANAKDFAGQQNVLRENVLSTYFARAYKVGNLRVKDWPNSPTDINTLFDKVVAPPLREGKKFGDLRTAWQARIRMEGLMQEHWTGGKPEGKIGMADAMRSPAYEKFLSDTLPDLRWQMERDLFKAGDERTAALHMLEQLQQNATHPKAAEWMKQMAEILMPKKEEGTAPETAAK